MDESYSPTAHIFPDYSLKSNSFEEKLEILCQSLQAEMLNSYQANIEEMQESCKEEIRKASENADLKVAEALNSVEQTRLKLVSNEKRGKIISNLMKYLEKKKDYDLLKSSFTIWKAAIDSQSSRLASKMAKNYHKQVLQRSAIKAWHSLTRDLWKKTVERKLSLEQDSKTTQLERHYEDKFSQLSGVIKDLEKQLEATKLAQIQQQEEMRAAFLRGVSALNAQAAGMFKTNNLKLTLPQQSPALNSISNLQSTKTPNSNVPKDVLIQSQAAPKNDIVPKTNGLVTRHIFKKEVL